MRYAYIKNGDAVDQVKRLTVTDGGPSSGPDAFINDFLCNINESPAIILSRSNRNRSYKKNNIEAHSFVFKGPLIIKLIYYIVAFVKTIYHLVTFKPDYIICGKSGSMLWACFFVSKLYKTPLIHSRHNRVIYFGQNTIKRIFSYVDNWIIKRATSVICHGPYLRDELLKIGVLKYKLFEFDINYNDMHALQKSIHLDENIEKKNIVYIGRLEWDKGVFDLINACLESLYQIPNLHLLFIGDGSAKLKLQNFIDKNTLQNKVKLHGHIKHHDLIYILKKSIVLITPTKKSFPEGRCMAGIEGLIIGTPIIAPNHGPFPYFVKDGINGLLYESDNINDLKRKIEILIENEEMIKTLREGAKKSAISLLKPDLTFGQAMKKALQVCSNKSEI